MAGKKQHFIPRHFQKPFIIKGSGDQIWMYRKGQSKPLIVSRTNAAAQNYFYSKPSSDGIPTLDDLITEYELTLHRTVDTIRLLPIGNDIPPNEISEVISHLNIRSSYMRGMVEEAAVSMADAIHSITTGSVNGQKIFLPKHKIPPAIEKLVVEQLEERGLMELTPVAGPTIAKLAYFGAREGADELVSEAKNLVAHLTGKLRDNAAQVGRQAQTTALKNTLAPEEQMKKLRKLNWSIAAGPAEGAILPDCTSVVFDGDKWASLALTESEKIQIVILPITPERLAIGRLDHSIELDLSDFNSIAAHAAHTFFLSSSRKQEFDNLLPKLGGQVRTQVSNMASSATISAVEEFMTGIPIGEATGEESTARRSWWSEQNFDQFSFSVKLHDFGDENLAQEISVVLRSVVEAFAKHLPISGISGFVIANDYKSALNSFDRGFDTNSDISPLEGEDRIGVGMPMSILVDGEVKTKIVLRSSVAISLISDDADAREEAITIVLHMLASSALTTLMQNKFPHQILKEVDDEYEGTLFEYTRGVFDSYFCALISCSAERLRELYEDMALESLSEMLEHIPVMRRDYRAHGDMEKLFPECSTLIGNCLTATARLIGCMQGQNVSLDKASQLRILLEKSGLLKWYELFRDDLRSFDEGLESWGSFEEIFFLNRHFERLAAHFSLIPEPTDDDARVYVHVPGLVDIDLMRTDE